MCWSCFNPFSLVNGGGVVNLAEKIDEWCLKHSAEELHKLTKIPRSSISDYRDGTEPSEERKKILSEIVGFGEEAETFVQEMQYVPLKEASQRLGMGIWNLQNGLKAGVFPFGVGFKGNGQKYNYYIFRGSFEKFIAENK